MYVCMYMFGISHFIGSTLLVWESIWKGTKDGNILLPELEVFNGCVLTHPIFCCRDMRITDHMS